ncbi:hypothetical protein C8R43DRAFT_1116513 [Mycena crocata]|nr:hypothetical protein C8R43DRAFT_1116513 [Mycena crocata]
MCKHQSQGHGSPSTSLSNSNSAEVLSSLHQLPPELILLVYDYLSETELFNLCEVSILSQKLTLLALLARHDISESEMQSQELSDVPSGALRTLSASYPTIIYMHSILNSAMQMYIARLLTVPYSTWPNDFQSFRESLSLSPSVP